MKKDRITIKFIAKKAGMSFSTVAKALHDDPAIHIDTRTRIQEIAKRYNYRPNVLAKGLRSRRTRTIGMILNDLQSPFYSEIYKAVGDILNKRGYTMLLADSNYDETLEQKNISTMISQGVEGIIISSVSENSENINLLLEEQIPSVFIDNRPANPQCTCVYVDHTEAARLGTEHLIRNGHRSILLLNGPEHLPSSRHFEEGYIQTLQKHGLPVQRELIYNNPITIEGTTRLFTAFFTGSHEDGKTVAFILDRFTAILTLSDVIAIGVYEAALQYGFTIPGTYSVVGYDNILATKYLNPALTTIKQPKELTGIQSITLLLEAIELPSAAHSQVILNPELIVRNSVRKLD